MMRLALMAPGAPRWPPRDHGPLTDRTRTAVAGTGVAAQLVTISAISPLAMPESA